jgi:hypothetical protein
VLHEIDFHALAGAQLVQRFPGELPVSGKSADRVVDVTACGRVREPPRLELRNHLQHAGHVLGRSRLEIRLLHAERRGILVHRLDEARGEALDRLLVLLGALDDLVLDIGDVANVGDLVTERPQPAPDHVERDQEPRMPQVTIIVYGHPAHVHAHPPRIDGNEFLLFPRQRVIDLQHAVCRSGRRRSMPAGSAPRNPQRPASDSLRRVRLRF